MRAAQSIQQVPGWLNQWLHPQRRLADRLPGHGAANEAMASLQQAARSATDALRRSPALRRTAGAGAGAGALRLARAHPALTAGLALGAVGVAVLLWRRRHARTATADSTSEYYEPEYL